MNEEPVRDENPPPAKKRSTHVANIDHYEQQAIRERQQISRWDRTELEDKYIRMQEDNLTLKRHTIKLDEKLKKMAVKLVRIHQDKKRAEGQSATSLKKPASSLHYEEKIDELSTRLRQCDLDKKQLMERLTVLQSQLDVASASHKNATYQTVPSRIDTGVRKDAIKKGMRVIGPPTARGKPVTPASPKPQSQLPRYGHSLLEEARDTNLALKKRRGHEIEQLHAELEKKDMYIEQLKNLNERDNQMWEQKLLELKQNQGGLKRTETQENIDLIRLKRELKDQESKLISVTSQYESLESNLRHMKASHDELLKQLEERTNQLKQEQSRVVALNSQLKRTPPETNRIQELEDQMEDARGECELLKIANEKLVSSAFDMEREREFRQRENALKVQIAQLEATLKADLGEKGNILDRLTAEREAAERSEKLHREIQREYYKLKEQHDELNEKMRFFTKESAVDFAEIEEALVLVKQKKERDEESLDFLNKVDDQKNKDMEKELMMLQADHAETIEELEKTRNMLIVQYQINKDYQQEVDAINRKMEENKAEYEAKLDEYAQLLDIRAARIRKLENQLKDVAYGTRQYKVKPEDEPGASDVEEVDESIQLEHGENLFEIHIGDLNLTQQAYSILNDQAPPLFCTWEFFEFETQATPVVKSATPKFDFTSLYVVKVDDFFLHYLQKESTVLEVHMAIGTEYRTVGTCRLKFRDIFDRSQGRLQRVADVISVDQSGVLLGHITFWVRLKVPMDQALRLYKERIKALGYISANEKVEHSTLQALDETAHTKPPDNINTLKVKVIRCKNLQSSRKDVQPSPYCVYKFFDFPDHDTALISNSNAPEFNDLQAFPVNMAADLDLYLKSRSLEVYVFDDTDPDISSYLGVAHVPLLSLAHNKAIKGTFELKRTNGSVNGTIDVILEWQYAYLPPPIGTKTHAQMVASTPVKREPLAMMEGESMDLSSVEHSPTRHRPPDSEIEDSLQPLSQAKRASPPTVMRKSAAKKNKTVDFDTTVTAHFPDDTSPQHSQPSIQVTQPPTIAPAEARQQPIRAEPHANQPIRTEGYDQQPMTSEDDSKVNLEADRLIREELGELSEATEPTTENITEASDQSGGFAPPPSRKEAARSPPLPPSAPPRTLNQLEPEVRKSAELVDDDDDVTEVTESMSGAGEETVTQGPTEQSRQLGDTNQSSGTYFEESEDETLTDDEEEEIPEEVEVTEEEKSITSDSEGIVISTPTPGMKNLNASLLTPGETVIVEVGHVSLLAESPVVADPEIRRLFVSYNFLGLDPAELETPVSLPKPKSTQQQINFNFRKVFHVDIEKNYSKRQFLASMLLPNSPDGGRIHFTLVCEPPEDDMTSDCYDIGIASISLPEILKTKKDAINTDLKIYHVEDTDVVIGILNVSVECLSTLQAVKEELPSDFS